MIDVDFKVTGVEVAEHAVSPLLHFPVQVTERVGGIHAVVLRCQVRIEPGSRKYDASEKARLGDLYGAAARWAETLKPMLWAHTNVMVPAFEGVTEVSLPVPCTFDFNVAATKYFHGLQHGEVPLIFLFSGTVFHSGPEMRLQIGQISWEKEARFRMPVSVWKHMMEMYYPNSAWLNLRGDCFDALYRFKVERKLLTWEAAIAALLAEATDGAPAGGGG